MTDFTDNAERQRFELTENGHVAFATYRIVGDELDPIAHGFTHYRLTMHPQRVAVRKWPSRAEAPGLLWVTREDALAAALPAPIRKLLKRI